jgi:hypothetical protein
MGSIATFGRVGILWTCGAVGLAFVLRTLILMWVIDRMDGIKLRRFLVPLIRPLIACGLMVAAILLARPVFSGFSDPIQLALEIALGAIVYLIGARFIFYDLAKDFFALLRTAMKKQP